jgi:hypothetical protein
MNFGQSLPLRAFVRHDMHVLISKKRYTQNDKNIACGDFMGLDMITFAEEKIGQFQDECIIYNADYQKARKAAKKVKESIFRYVLNVLFVGIDTVLIKKKVCEVKECILHGISAYSEIKYLIKRMCEMLCSTKEQSIGLFYLVDHESMFIEKCFHSALENIHC